MEFQPFFSQISWEALAGTAASRLLLLLSCCCDCCAASTSAAVETAAAQLNLGLGPRPKCRARRPKNPKVANVQPALACPSVTG